MKKKKLVMIGNGMAGVRTIEEILKLAPDAFEITIFGNEPHPNYNRIQLSYVLQGEKTLQDIIMNDWKWYEENHITIHTNEAVISIDTTNKQVTSENGRVVIYDELIIATGSSSFILPVPGATKQGVIGFRNIHDCEMMINTSRQYKKAVVIGGGLLGLEAAKGLLNLGMQVDVVHLMPYLMERQLDAESAKMLKNQLEA
jgi:nitrite reductase (NADH) large subunit